MLNKNINSFGYEIDYRHYKQSIHISPVVLNKPRPFCASNIIC